MYPILKRLKNLSLHDFPLQATRQVGVIIKRLSPETLQKQQHQLTCLIRDPKLQQHARNVIFECVVAHPHLIAVYAKLCAHLSARLTQPLNVHSPRPFQVALLGDCVRRLEKAAAACKVNIENSEASVCRTQGLFQSTGKVSREHISVAKSKMYNAEMPLLNTPSFAKSENNPKFVV